MSINAQDQRGSKRSARTLGDLGERPKETRRLLCQCGCGARARGASFSMRLARLLTGGREDVQLQGSVNTRSCPSATMDSLRTISIRFALTVARSIAFRTSSSVGGSLRHRNVNRECSCPPLWQAGAGEEGAGFIPARAGHHVSRERGAEAQGSIPARAGHRLRCAAPSACWGPSPRVRGSRYYDPLASRPAFGFIPARAGKPPATPKLGPAKGPSPRVRGTIMRAGDGPMHWGSSPRVRGSRYQRLRARLSTRVHPRACGEAANGVAVTPPRFIPARAGKPPTFLRHPTGLRGFIPARAGKPRNRQIGAKSCTGPSPRVRGSPKIDCVRLIA